MNVDVLTTFYQRKPNDEVGSRSKFSNCVHVQCFGKFVFGETWSNIGISKLFTLHIS